MEDSYKKLCQKMDDMNKELPHDSKPRTEEIPNDKTREQVVVFSENKTNGNKENIKHR